MNARKIFITGMVIVFGLFAMAQISDAAGLKAHLGQDGAFEGSAKKTVEGKVETAKRKARPKKKRPGSLLAFIQDAAEANFYKDGEITRQELLRATLIDPADPDSTYSESTVDREIRDAKRAGIIEDVPGKPGTYRFITRLSIEQAARLPEDVQRDLDLGQIVGNENLSEARIDELTAAIRAASELPAVSASVALEDEKAVLKIDGNNLTGYENIRTRERARSVMSALVNMNLVQAEAGAIRDGSRYDFVSSRQNKTVLFTEKYARENSDFVKEVEGLDEDEIAVIISVGDGWKTLAQDIPGLGALLDSDRLRIMSVGTEAAIEAFIRLFAGRDRIDLGETYQTTDDILASEDLVEGLNGSV